MQKSVNKAIRASVSDYLVLLDSEVTVTKKWLENMLECANIDDTTGIITPLLDTKLYQGVNSMPQTDSRKVNALLKGFNLEMMATMVENAPCNNFPMISFINHPYSNCPIFVYIFYAHLPGVFTKPSFNLN